MTRQLYCAIIGDINRSREIPGRARLQRRFLRTIDRLNEEFKDCIVSEFRFRVSEGDAFEGLLLSPANSYMFVSRLRELMDPVAFSIGVGVGTVSTLPVRDVDMVDGEVFHRARAGLVRAKKMRQEVIFDLDSPALGIVNALVGLMEKEWHRLTPRQQEIVRWMNALESQERVAKKLKISQPAVSKVWSAPTVRKMSEGGKAVHAFLASLSGK